MIDNIRVSRTTNGWILQHTQVAKKKQRPSILQHGEETEVFTDLNALIARITSLLRHGE